MKCNARWKGAPDSSDQHVYECAHEMGHVGIPNAVGRNDVSYHSAQIGGGDWWSTSNAGHYWAESPKPPAPVTRGRAKSAAAKAIG